MQSHKLIHRHINDLDQNDLDQYDDIIDTYYQVYVKDHLDGILDATTDKAQETAVLGLIKSAKYLKEDDYRQQVRGYYPASDEIATIFIVMRRLWTGELNDRDKIISHLNKLPSANPLSQVDLCKRISARMDGLITDYINAKENINDNKENSVNPAPVADSPGRAKLNASKPIPIAHDPRFTRSIIGTSPRGGRSSPRLLEEFCRSPRSPANREPRF